MPSDRKVDRPVGAFDIHPDLLMCNRTGSQSAGHFADSGDRERPIRSIVNTGSGDHEHLLSLA
jgi:hypothetical protein